MDISRLRDYYADHTPSLMGECGGSAVLVPLVEHDGETCLLYEVRAASIRQPGEICFPGGKREMGETPLQCALRETWEELAIPETAVTVLGAMDFVYIRAHSLLRPFLAVLDPAALPRMRPDPAEVADTLLLPLPWLKDHPPQVYTHRQAVEAPGFPYAEAGIQSDYPWRPYFLEVPLYRGTPKPLWGITARITMDVVENL